MVNCDVVIIDSGISIANDSPINGICINKTNNGFSTSGSIMDEIGHGTIIYSIISKHVNSDKIYIIKLSQKKDDCDDSILIAALEYIKNNVKCKIINISLGVKTGENIKRLYELCNEISSKGIIIVSAFDNEGCHSYPASFDCVIGVDNKHDLKHTTEFDFVENSPINILAKGGIQRLTTPRGRVLLAGGSSVACAHITSILANNSTDELDINSALEYLRSKSRYVFSAYKSKNAINGRFFKITNAIVFPFAKEAHAFVRFTDMLSFNIQGYYDIKRSGKVGRKLSSYCEKTKTEECIKDIETVSFSNIDTIILGHLDEINAISNRDYRAELIRKAIAERVNIYSFDPLDAYANMLQDSGIKYFYPSVTPYDVPQNTFGKLFKIPKPVVGIFGTSSRQGKFSLQLELKGELESLGYDVGTIGTEPHSLLFDYDVAFPIGYNSTVYINGSETVLYLNNEINNLCFNGKEIILVATQAQIVPYYCNNLLEFPTIQYHFAVGTKPDAIIMCINYHDEITYIRNSLYALMGLTDARIIAIVMYPITYASDWNGIFGNARRKITYEEFRQKAAVLSETFHIPIYMLGEEQHMKELCNTIIDFFDSGIMTE